MPMSNPIVFINGYLQEMVPRYLEAHGSTSVDFFGNSIRFFPTSPTLIDTLTETAAGQNNDITNDVFAVYDRMFKLRRKSFPHIKCEQALYYFYKTTTDNQESSAMAAMAETAQAVYDLLDRGDESAEEINKWIKSKLNSEGLYVPFGSSPQFSPVFFHDTRIFQLEETRDIIDFGTARTFAGNKIIVDYEYHASVDFNAVPSDFDDNNPPIA